MKTNNWQQSEQIISSWRSTLSRILLEYVDEEWFILSSSKINWQLDWWLPFEKKYFTTKFLPLILDIAKDMKQAKEFLWMNTRVEDNILSL